MFHPSVVLAGREDYCLGADRQINLVKNKKTTELKMGDKGGKKDKEKGKKQMAQKHDQKVKETKEKQPKKVEK